MITWRSRFRWRRCGSHSIDVRKGKWKSRLCNSREPEAKALIGRECILYQASRPKGLGMGDPWGENAMKVVDRFTRWLRETDERRRSARHGEPDLVAYGGLLASPCEICNISSTGIHVRTPERWYPGTRIQLTLDRKQLDKHIHGPESIR